MYVAFCVLVYRFITSKHFLFEFIFAGIDNPKYEWIRPAEVFLGMYLCGCMPFIPFISGIAIFFLYGIKWAIFAFLLGIVCAPLVIKIIWKAGINVMLVVANKSEAE